MPAFSASAAAASDFVAICAAAANHKSLVEAAFCYLQLPLEESFWPRPKGVKRRLGESLLKLFAALINET